MMPLSHKRFLANYYRAHANIANRRKQSLPKPCKETKIKILQQRDFATTYEKGLRFAVLFLCAFKLN